MHDFFFDKKASLPKLDIMLSMMLLYTYSDEESVNQKEREREYVCVWMKHWNKQQYYMAIKKKMLFNVRQLYGDRWTGNEIHQVL